MAGETVVEASPKTDTEETKKEKIVGKKRSKEEEEAEPEVESEDDEEDDEDDVQSAAKKRRVASSTSPAKSSETTTSSTSNANASNDASTIKSDKKPSSYSFREAAMEVLRRAGRPLSAKDITQRMMDEKMIATAGKTPDRTVAALMYSEIKQKGKQSAFLLASRGVFGLAEFTAEQNKNVAGTSTGYMDEEKSRKKKRTSTSGSSQTPRKKRTPKKSKKGGKKTKKESDSEKTDESGDEDEKPAAKKETKKEETKREPAKVEIKSKRTMLNTPVKNTGRNGANTKRTQQHVNGGAKGESEDGYNDDYGYMYLRYFLDLNRRKDEEDYSPEDDCFICKNGGDLICCDFPDCSKVYHLNCLKMNKIPEGKWYCPWHFCAVCKENSKPGNTANVTVYHCATCTNAYCEEHLPQNHIRKGGFIICEKCMPYFQREIEDTNDTSVDESNSTAASSEKSEKDM